MEAAAGEPKTTPEELRAAIERLLISKREGVQRHREYGRALGTAWALHSTSYHQLRRLRTMRDAASPAGLATLLAHDPSGRFCGIVGARGIGEHQEPLEFWCGVLAPEDLGLQADPDFVGGFADGADGLFRQIEACL